MIKILKHEKELKFDSFTFPGGELSIRLNNRDYNFFSDEREVSIITRLTNTDEIFNLSLIKDALERLGKTNINLIMPYIPYARQDRVCNKGESFSLKVFCRFLNSLKFNSVTVFDPHSDVSAALIENVRVISQFDIINKWLDFTNRAKSCVLVSPDAGANKKTSEIAKYFQHEHFIRADKLRDLSNGNIKETIVYIDDFKGQDVVVCDDILDGCKTFTELAKVCKSKNCGKFILYGTHSIFSKGTDICFENGIDEIWTTNSYRKDLIKSDKLHILNLEEKFLTYS